MSTVAVIDYGMGNLHSVAKALEHVKPDERVLVTRDTQDILAADRVILPGVGAIRDCMGELVRLGLDKIVHQVIASGKPLLGICVGVQLLTEFSEENGGHACLGAFQGKAHFFGNDLKDESGEKLKVPHMGWNRVTQRKAHPLWANIADDSRFYFVHSYYIKAGQTDEIAGSCHYGLEFDVALSRDNVFAVQFHPEKSHEAGLQLLKNFLHWNGKP
ncbi:imidazole glycerol phosphate synthase subunit HisH [Pokkaliibacter sp. CJK22405]|uniref:imidazole glycerol phosphate synthase subunit HisH n=1 Tax=Pokkaliibacter sp. CJK22405 TaxID=3384615 RepID=UPI0039854B55